MSKFRTLQDQFKVEGKPELKKSFGGKNLCRWCETEVSPPRRTFCSDECVHEHRLRSDPRYARRQVIKRDRYICQLCGINCQKLRKELKALPLTERRSRATALSIPLHRMNGCLFDIDHILPVCLGGGLCGLDNLRLLCITGCHQKVTAELRLKLAKLKKEQNK